jgi:hypothetical protein
MFFILASLFYRDFDYFFGAFGAVASLDSGKVSATAHLGTAVVFEIPYDFHQVGIQVCSRKRSHFLAGKIEDADSDLDIIVAR